MDCPKLSQHQEFGGSREGETLTEPGAHLNFSEDFVHDVNRDGLGKPNVHDLPYEVLAHMFRLYVDVDLANYVFPQNRHVFPLGAICQKWRDIAWRDQRLWTSLTFCMREETTEIQVQLAVEWLRRSGKLPLDISITVSGKMVESVLIPLMDVVNQSLDRCHNLSLWGLGSLALSRLSRDSKSTTALKTMIAGYLKGPLNLPSVAPISLCLSDVFLADLTLDWRALRDINMDEVFVDEALQILMLAPQLKCCEFEYILNRQMEPRSGNKFIKCPELDDIHLCSSAYGNDDALTAIFQATTFPKLKRCSIVYYEDFSTPVFLDFVSRSCCSITELFLNRHGISGEDLILIASALPSITTLYLGTYQPYQDSLSSNSPFCDALCLDSRYSSGPYMHHVLLPRLEDLTIETSCRFPWQCLSGFRWSDHSSHDDTQTLLGGQGRPQLKSISILYQLEYDRVRDKGSVYSDDSDEEPLTPTVFIPDHSIRDWGTFSELLILGTKIHLNLKVQKDHHSHHNAISLFSLSYKILEEARGSAPDCVKVAMDDYDRQRKKKVV